MDNNTNIEFFGINAHNNNFVIVKICKWATKKEKAIFISQSTKH